MWMGPGFGGTNVGKHLRGWDSCGYNDWDISGSNTGITYVTGTSTDPATGNTYVGFGGNLSPGSPASVLVFSPGLTGNITPYEVLGSSAFYCYIGCDLVAPYIDDKSNIWVGLESCGDGCFDPKLFRFNAGDHGSNVAPEHAIQSSCDNVGAWAGITGDGNGHIFAIGRGDVGGEPTSIQEFNESDTGDHITPITCLHGANVYNYAVYSNGIAIGHNGKTYVTAYCTLDNLGYCSNNGWVYIWNKGDTGNTAPEAWIGGGATSQIVSPVGVAIGPASDNYAIYVADAGAGKVLKFAAGTTGNTAPEATYTIPDVWGFSICSATVIQPGDVQCTTVPAFRKHPRS